MTQNIAFAPTLPAQLPTGAPHEPWVRPTAGRTKSRGPLSIMLGIVTIFALVAAGLLGAEMYARETAIDKIRAAVACEIEDSEDTVSVSFSTSPPVLWQYVNDKYTGFTVTTHGHIRSAQGMTADIVVDDIDLNGDANKKGTVGAINATITWTTDGIRQSLNRAVKAAIDEHLKGSIFGFLKNRLSPEFVTGVKTDPSAGTITVEGILNSSISVKPETTADGGIRLVIQPDSFKLGGEWNLPQENLQKKLDEMTGKLTDNELNIRVDSLEVLNDSVVGKFSAKNVDIPNRHAGGGRQTGGCEGL
jgi:LmeA-like phospholipid-binding